MTISMKRNNIGYITKAIPFALLLFFFSLSGKSTLMAQNFEKLRNDMVENQLRKRDVRSRAVLDPCLVLQFLYRFSSLSCYCLTYLF